MIKSTIMMFDPRFLANSAREYISSMSAEVKKQFAIDEEMLREMLKKMVKLSGMKYSY